MVRIRDVLLPIFLNQGKNLTNQLVLNLKKQKFANRLMSETLLTK